MRAGEPAPPFHRFLIKASYGGRRPYSPVLEDYVEMTLLKRHRRMLLLIAMAGATAMLLFVLMSAGGGRVATAQAKSAHAASAEVTSGIDPAGGPVDSQAGGPDSSTAAAPGTTTGSDPAGNPQASGTDTTSSSDTTGSDPAGNPQAGGTDANSGSDPAGPDTGAGGNSNCDGNCTQ
jgi:hypothetical protein